MKTNWTIFFDKGVMKGFETPNYLKKEADYIDLECFNGALDDAARLSALPVEEESKERVRQSMVTQDSYFKHHPMIWNKWQPDQTKEYQIEAEFREEERGWIKHPNKDSKKVLVLSSNY